MPDCTFRPWLLPEAAARAGCLPAFESGSSIQTQSQMKSSANEAAPKKAAATEAIETYLAPPPPKRGCTVGLDCHPDTFTAAVFHGQTPHDARQLECRENLSLARLLAWAQERFTCADLFVLEAGGNSFAVCQELGKRGLRAVVLESAYVGRHAKPYADNDRMAAARIALVYLAGNAPAVWVPDAQTRERRELLHVYARAVREHTAAGNALKSYLNGHAIRLGSRSLSATATQVWIESRRAWSPLQKNLLEGYFFALEQSLQQRRRYLRIICQEVSREPLMLRLMKLLGIGKINAFGLLAVIGDVRRFCSAQKLVAYLGLNPGQRESGHGKRIGIGIGQRGRGDMRHLLIQGAQAILRTGKASALGQWGWKLFARKGSRNVAVAAVARKLVVQVWHLLHGNPPMALEKDQSFTIKLRKLAIHIGKELRIELGLGLTLGALHRNAAKACARMRTTGSRTNPMSLMGAMRPQTPHRSPRQAFGGNSVIAVAYGPAITQVQKQK
jgi:transposase